MRETVGKPLSVKAGDLVVIVCTLPRKAKYARLGVWSAVDGYELSPHVQSELLGVIDRGMPRMVSPVFTTLGDHARKRVLSFVADEDLTVAVLQEKDVAGDASAKVRIKKYGTFAQAIRRRVRNAIGAIRSRAVGSQRSQRGNSLV